MTIMGEKLFIMQCYSSPAAQPYVKKQLSISLQVSRIQSSGQLSLGGWFQIIKVGEGFGNNLYIVTNFTI